MDNVQRIQRRIHASFGGSSNGVSIIFERDDLPEQFGIADWDGWFFKPAPEAFAWAHDAGLIAPWKLSGKWTYTALGRELASIMTEQDPTA
jgi:hypothetical protein